MCEFPAGRLENDISFFQGQASWQVTKLGSRLCLAQSHLKNNVPFFLLAESLFNQRPSKLGLIRSGVMPVSYAGTESLMHMTHFTSDSSLAEKAYTIALIVVRFSHCKKRVIRIMYGAEPRASCRGLFRKLEILPVPCQYILSLMLFIIDKANNLQTGLEIHGLQTRSKN